MTTTDAATPGDGSMGADEALAREAIRYTLSVYNSSGDRGRLDELAAAFAPDGILEFSGSRFVGRAAIIEALGGTVELTHKSATAPDGPAPLVRHHLTTSRIELVNDREAQGWTYFFVVTGVGPDHSGVYVDRFAALDGRWLITHRRVKIDWQDPGSVMAAAED
jgi:hypothetical protein